jgi:hypothetical protein
MQNFLTREVVSAISASSSHLYGTHFADCIPSDRYSNTLLVSLNNRISIRDAYSARGGVVDCPVMTTSRGVSASGAATEAMVSEAEESQNHLPMIQPVAEAGVQERVEQSESCDFTIRSYLE